MTRSDDTPVEINDDDLTTGQDVKPLRKLAFNVAGAPVKMVFKAIRENFPADQLRDLLKAAPLDGRDGHGLTYLHAAAAAGNLRALSVLINEGCDLHAKFEGLTPLMLAAGSYGGEDAAVMLAKADHDFTPHAMENGVTPLHVAAEKFGNERLVEALLEHGHSPLAEDAKGRKPLWYALNSKRETALTLCAAGGCPPEDRAKFEEAIETQQHIYGFDYDWKLLLDYAAKKDHRALWDAVDRKGPQKPRELTPEAEAFFKDVTSHGSSFRFEKCYNDPTGLDDRDYDNMTPLMAGIADKCGSDMWAVRSLAWKSDPRAVDDAGRTVLHYVVQHTDSPASAIFDSMAGTADIDAQDNFGRTPLMVTMDGGNFLSELMECGANPHIEDNLGLTAMDYGKFYKSNYCTELLAEEMEKHGWDEEAPAGKPYKRRARGYGY